MLLRRQAVSDRAVAEALCSVMLLEESSPRQALTDFLMARKAAMQKLLNQPHHGGCGFAPNAGPSVRGREASRTFSGSSLTAGSGLLKSGRFLLAGSGIKAQICSLVELLATTLSQAHALFYTAPEGLPPAPPLPCGLLFSTLETITGHSPAGELSDDLAFVRVVQ